MSKGSVALENLRLFLNGSAYGEYYLNIIEKELKAFEIVKDFVWVENGEMHLGVYGDVEITLGQDDFESKEKYDLLKEALE